MRRFEIHRQEDPSGISGTGFVAEGVRFSDGAVALRWRTTTSSTAIYDNMGDLIAVHGHGGATQVRWIDEIEEG